MNEIVAAAHGRCADCDRGPARCPDCGHPRCARHLLLDAREGHVRREHVEHFTVRGPLLDVARVPRPQPWAPFFVEEHPIYGPSEHRTRTVSVQVPVLLATTHDSQSTEFPIPHARSGAELSEAARRTVVEAWTAPGVRCTSCRDTAGDRAARAVLAAEARQQRERKVLETKLQQIPALERPAGPRPPTFTFSPQAKTDRGAAAGAYASVLGFVASFVLGVSGAYGEINPLLVILPVTVILGWGTGVAWSYIESQMEHAAAMRRYPHECAQHVEALRAADERERERAEVLAALRALQETQSE